MTHLAVALGNVEEERRIRRRHVRGFELLQSFLIVAELVVAGALVQVLPGGGRVSALGSYPPTAIRSVLHWWWCCPLHVLAHLVLLSAARRMAAGLQIARVEPAVQCHRRHLQPRQIEAIAKFAVEKDLLVLSDEIYSELTFEGEHVSIAGLPGDEGTSDFPARIFQGVCHDRLAHRFWAYEVFHISSSVSVPGQGRM